ncbi:glycosyltransferase [Novosphingobium sp.]|uniref:glycosyltransferase n=1 Tax=Novosphingobium sp. TaxID=1874826 RepID=UPI0025F92EE6|nr:glycosyltransferase [Novosphingobium sp.]
MNRPKGLAGHAKGQTIQIALAWTQFIPAHVDRIVAVQARLQGRAQITAVEVAPTSLVYGDFAPADALGRFDHVQLFPDGNVNTVAALPLLWRSFRALAGKDIVCLGIPYSLKVVLLLVPLLRLCGCRVYIIYDSKFDDRPRSVWFEALKSLALASYSGAIVPSSRTRDYLRFLGFRNRIILGGADGLDIARITQDAKAGQTASTPSFAERDFVYVGRLAEEKNLRFLLTGFARFISCNPDSERRLKLVGAGPLEPELRVMAERLGLAGQVEFTGFKQGPELAAILSNGLGLVLVSTSEPWGFVINEACALGLPLLISETPGARDVLVRNLVNGFVVAPGAVDSLAAAMTALGRDETAWRAMGEASRQRAALGDCQRFADAVELLVDPAAQPAGEDMDRYLATFDETDGKRG